MKKKKKKGGMRRRRRVGAVHPVIMQTIQMAGAAALGAITGAFVNQAVKSSFPTAPSWVGGGASVAIGAALPLFVKPSPLITGAAAGLVGAGALFAVNETFLSLPGISGIPVQTGYLRRTVGNNAGMLKRTVAGNLSNTNRTLGQIGALYDN